MQARIDKLVEDVSEIRVIAARQEVMLAQMHSALKGDENDPGLVQRISKAEKDIFHIKVVWSTLAATGGFILGAWDRLSTWMARV